MRALESKTGHVIYNLAYTYKFQLKTTIEGAMILYLNIQWAEQAVQADFKQAQWEIKPKIQVYFKTNISLNFFLSCQSVEMNQNFDNLAFLLFTYSNLDSFLRTEMKTRKRDF